MSQNISETVEEVVKGWSQLGPSGLAEVLLDWFVIIPRRDLPRASEGPHEGYAKTETVEGTFESAFYRDSPHAPASDPDWHLNRARHHISMAEYLQSKNAEISEAKRKARRDEIAAELTDEQWDDVKLKYPVLGPFAQRAIDRIIELEEAAK
ncbi:hypothetical protein [Arthrobacter sp. MDT1-65]